MYALRDTDNKGRISKPDLASACPHYQGNQTGLRNCPEQRALRKHGDYYALKKMLEEKKDMTGKLVKSNKCLQSRQQRSTIVKNLTMAMGAHSTTRC